MKILSNKRIFQEKSDLPFCSVQQCEKVGHYDQLSSLSLLCLTKLQSAQSSQGLYPETAIQYQVYKIQNIIASSAQTELQGSTDSSNSLGNVKEAVFKQFCFQLSSPRFAFGIVFGNIVKYFNNR